MKVLLLIAVFCYVLAVVPGEELAEEPENMELEATDNLDDLTSVDAPKNKSPKIKIRPPQKTPNKVRVPQKTPKKSNPPKHKYKLTKKQKEMIKKYGKKALKVEMIYADKMYRGKEVCESECPGKCECKSNWWKSVRGIPLKCFCVGPFPEVSEEEYEEIMKEQGE